MDSDEQLTVELVLKSLTKMCVVWDDMGKSKGGIISNVAEIMRDVVHIEDYENQASTDNDSLLKMQAQRLVEWEHAYLLSALEYGKVALDYSQAKDVIRAANSLHSEVSSIIKELNHKCAAVLDTEGDCSPDGCMMHSGDDEISCALIRLENAANKYSAARQKASRVQL